MRKLLFLVTSIIFLAGCAPVISKESLSLVDREISFTELRKAPDSYTGKHLLLGGEIARVSNSKEGGELELVQFSTDEDGEITDKAKSGGRFIAKSAEFLEPALYRTGLLVTVVGKAQGKRSKLLGDVLYTYPVIAIREIHIWKPEELSYPPTFHFGVGVGTILY